MTSDPTKKRTALITGGNRGIGFEVCRQLAEAGHDVILTARREADAVDAAKKLAAEGLEVEPQPLDVTDSNSIARIATDFRQRPALLDALVNNAGISLKGFNADMVKKTMAVNFFGPLKLTDALLTVIGMTGRIVMVSSGMGALSCLSPELRKQFTDPALTRDELVGMANRFQADVEGGHYRERGWPRSAYSVSKVALNALTRLLETELEGSGKLVNAVCPGWVRTRMTRWFATRSTAKGANGIVWAATLPDDGPNGGFHRDRKPIRW